MPYAQIDGLPEPEPVEPSRGSSLADHVQIGFAYQMHIDGECHKVRLAEAGSLAIRKASDSTKPFT